jgi:uncharacterized protein (TIRG00374 family)
MVSPPQLEDPGEASLKERLLRGAAPRILTSLLVAVGFVWLLARGGLPLVPSKEELSRVPLWAALCFALLHLLSNMVRSHRWLYLLRPIAPNVRPSRVTGIGLVGFAAIFFAPLRMGEAVRPFLISRGREVSFTQAAGSIVAERVMDGVFITVSTSLALLVATKVSPLPNRLGELPLPLAAVPAAVLVATLGFCGLFLAMTAFYFAREPARRLTRRVVGAVSPRAASWAEKTLEHLAQSLSFLRSRRNLGAFLLSSFVGWALAFMAQWMLLVACGLPASFAQATAVIGILGLGVVVPAGPGLFGAFQVASFSALCLFFPIADVRAEGTALVFVSYVAYLAINVAGLAIGSRLLAASPRA